MNVAESGSFADRTHPPVCGSPIETFAVASAQDRSVVAFADGEIDRQRFGAGEAIASVLVKKKPTYHHGACRYPATALLSQRAAASDTGCRNEPTSKCSATTTKGKPCNNVPTERRAVLRPSPHAS
jgi:hypothetical protein